MKLIFESTGATTGLETWLKSFKEIADSLLIEVDLQKSEFVAKSTYPDRTIVKFGRITFTEASIQVVSVTDKDGSVLSQAQWNELHGGTGRIFCGIFTQLDKFVKTIAKYSTTDNYKIYIDFGDRLKTLEDGSQVTELMGTKMTFESLTLTMNVACADTEEFMYITDDKFNNVIANIADPMTFTVNRDTLKQIIDISSIYGEDVNKDILEFSAAKESNGEWILHAIDQGRDSFNFKVAYAKDAESEGFAEVKIPVVRKNFILAAKSDTEDEGSIIIGADENTGRIKLTSGTSFVTIIASVKI